MTEYNRIVVLEDGKTVTKVKPNANIQLVADFSEWGVLSFQTEYLVTDLAGQPIHREYVGINVATGNSWADWKAPSVVGNYIFYPDSADLTKYTSFEVTNFAEEIPGNIPWNWIIAGAGILIAAVIVTRGKKNG
jgi:hypothetical protein